VEKEVVWYEKLELVPDMMNAFAPEHRLRLPPTKIGEMLIPGLRSDTSMESVRTQFMTAVALRGFRSAETQCHCGENHSVTIRIPAQTFRGSNRVWHRDASGMDYRIVVWSNKRITEFHVGDGTVLPAFEPNSLVVFDNKYVEHRAPEWSRNRWFAHMLVER